MHAVFRNAGFLIAIAASVALTGGCAKTHLDSGPADRHPAEEKKITVARVNGTAISLYSLLNMTNRMNAINEKASVAETPEETRKKALDQLIFRELAYQEAVREGLHVEDQLVDREMNRFIMSVGHEDGFNEYLKSQNMTAVEVRAEIERALLLQRIAAREVMEKVTVTDEDVRKEYELHQSAFVTPEKVTVTDLVMTSGGEEALRKAE
jgi:peptidyl-prolyl cis-trans isomerase C